MPKFSQASASLLVQCHPDLQMVMNEAIKTIDFSILPSTIRTIEDQKHFVAEGKSKTMNSKHLKGADGFSHAVDIWKYPINWNDEKGQAELARYILGISDAFFASGKIKNKVAWGGDWKSFVDMPHFELI
ncbi:MAG: M15 family metallopeptidase [Endomicrobium sp.]|jgi:peptidoglycan L-alanyl-D-glutamate endopeptidase CwlK|nr:M15 family metallopeptidase [Endomicrobium sp.]